MIFFLFHIEIEGKGGWIIGGGGGQRVCCPLSNYWGPGTPGPLHPPLLPTPIQLSISQSLRPDFTSNLVHGLAFGTPKFCIAPCGKINHGLVSQSSNCDVKSGLRPDFTSKLVCELAFGTPKFYIAPYDKINHGLVNMSSNCDVKSGLSSFQTSAKVLTLSCICLK